MDTTTHPQDPFPQQKPVSPEPVAGKAGKLEQAVSGVHQKVDSVAGAADHALSQAKPTIERVAKRVHDSIDRQERYVEDTVQYIAAHPIKALAIGFFAGVVLSRIL